ITANVVSPGYIADTEFFGDNLTDERRASLIDAAMTKRAGAPEDIAETIWFLASAGAGQITGQTFAVNGGEQPTR
ncbi:3-oxoacyl-ACP reductase, partial [Burkholderia multivorans]